ncbi:MAG: hypothetical protein ACOC9E_03450 [Chloroflexota bacterium]
MVEQTWRRILLLLLLGAGTFWVIAALLSLLLRVTLGGWRPFLSPIVLAAVFLTIPSAYYLRNRFIAG